VNSGNTRPADLVVLADELGTSVARLYTSIRRPLLGENVSFPRMRVISILLDNGPQRISQLAYTDQVSQPSLTVMVDGMEQQGWVERRRDPSDGRAVLVALTEQGKKEVRRVRRIRSEALAQRLSAMPEEFGDSLRDAADSLRRLVDLLTD
jgi:DNA-binding MarR family transcriptional regulator